MGTTATETNPPPTTTQATPPQTTVPDDSTTTPPSGDVQAPVCNFNCHEYDYSCITHEVIF